MKTDKILAFIKDLFMLKYLPSPGNDAGFGLLFVIGLLTSFHCLGMCGGIVMSQTIGRINGRTEGGRTERGWVVPSAMYNAGRVLSYTLVGGIVGGLGRLLSFNGALKGMVPLLGGLFMIIMGINLLGIFPALRRFKIPVPSFAARKLAGKNNYTPFFVGVLTGLMPCGPLQIIQLYALGTRSVVFGALSMFIFAAGTVPALFAFGALHSFINRKHSEIVMKLSAVFVVILGFVMVNRGLALSGVSLPFFHRYSLQDGGRSKIRGNVQTVVTGIEADSYPAITVQKGIPVKWTIIVDEEDLNECNKTIIIPKFKITKNLSAGYNVIEFTPEEEGELIYTCWMGMIKGKITVVTNLNEIPAGGMTAGGGQTVPGVGDKELTEVKNNAPLNQIYGSCVTGTRPGECQEIPESSIDCKKMADGGITNITENNNIIGEKNVRFSDISKDEEIPENSEILKYPGPINKTDLKTEYNEKNGEAKSIAGDKPRSQHSTQIMDDTGNGGPAGTEFQSGTDSVSGNGCINETGSGKDNDNITDGGNGSDSGKPDKEKKYIWEGYLIDKHCFEIIKPEKETRTCLLMEECVSSGYGIAVRQKDGSYRFFPFDINGHRLAHEYLKNTIKNTGFQITVKGTLKGNTIVVAEFNGNR